LLILFLKEIKKLKIQNSKREVVAMKTKKFTVYFVLSLFVFSPFFNFEGWAAGRIVPIVHEEPSPGQEPSPDPLRPVCRDICACDYAGYWSCTTYCCVDEAGNDCLITGYSSKLDSKCYLSGGWNGSIFGRVAGWIRYGEIPK
jgi:hypothetical protein